jgi:hypothetical protein
MNKIGKRPPQATAPYEPQSALVCITSVTWAALGSVLPSLRSPYEPPVTPGLLDERILRALRRVLEELEIEVEHCADPTAAKKLLARQTFEAEIADCAEEDNLSWLKSIRMG